MGVQCPANRCQCTLAAGKTCSEGEEREASLREMGSRGEREKEPAKRNKDRSPTPTSSGKTATALRACMHFAQRIQRLQPRAYGLHSSAAGAPGTAAPRHILGFKEPRQRPEGRGGPQPRRGRIVTASEVFVRPQPLQTPFRSP